MYLSVVFLQQEKTEPKTRNTYCLESNPSIQILPGVFLHTEPEALSTSEKNKNKKRKRSLSLFWGDTQQCYMITPGSALRSHSWRIWGPYMLPVMETASAAFKARCPRLYTTSPESSCFENSSIQVEKSMLVLSYAPTNVNIL